MLGKGVWLPTFRHLSFQILLIPKFYDYGNYELRKISFKIRLNCPRYAACNFLKQ